MSGATVYVNDLSRVTQFISSKQLTASVLASDLTGTAAGNLAVTVQNPSPSAGVSNVFPFTLQNPLPVVASVAPSTLLAGNPTNITITGSGFMNGATIQVGGQSLSTQFVNPTTLYFAITVEVGSFAVTITNPAPTPGASNEVPVIGTAAGPGMSLIIASVGPGGDTISTGGGALSSTGRYFVFDSIFEIPVLAWPPVVLRLRFSTGRLPCQSLDSLILESAATDAMFLRSKVRTREVIYLIYTTPAKVRKPDALLR